MLMHNNIDRSDAAVNTRYPFCWHCKLQACGTILPDSAFTTIKLYPDETKKLPCKLLSIDADGNAVFSDADGIPVGTWKMTLKPSSASEYLTGMVYNENNVIVGHLRFRRDIPGMLLAAARLSGGKFTTAYDDFVLLPQCHVLLPSGQARAIRLGNTVTTANVSLYTGAYMEAVNSEDDEDTKADGVLSYSLMRDFDPSKDAATNGICKLIVGGTTTWIGGRHLLIKPAKLSNLRVETSGSIAFKGVKDA